MPISVCIVGHGESLKGAGLGREIDKHFVVRLKNCSMLLAEPHDYGTRTDAMCSSTEVLPHLPKVKASEYWGYPKKGDYSPKRVNWLKRHIDQRSKVFIPLETCNLWNAAFLELGGRHPNVSTGMGAVIIALELKRPKVLYLAGFDNVVNPKTHGYRCTVPTPFNSNGTKDTGHDWEKENELLAYLQEYYKTKIIDLAGHNNRTPGRLPEVRGELSREP
ncbi:MAG TPA: hypothetical protein VJ742_07265 [Nitrososphaera sp.]|nr:hypothetical protein [Nitrososphaera sp.]